MSTFSILDLSHLSINSSAADLTHPVGYYKNISKQQRPQKKSTWGQFFYVSVILEAGTQDEQDNYLPEYP